MTSDQTRVLLTFGVYLALMLLLGGIAYRRTRSLSDYILGGRRLGSWVAALSAQASDMSGWLLLGLPGLAYAAGLEAFWLGLGLLLGIYLNWRLVAEPLRRQTRALDNALTLPDFLERRFRDQSRLLRVLSAVFILFFFLFYTSAGLVAGGKLFHAVFDLSYTWAVIVGASVVILYTFLGGFLAVAWTDVVQAGIGFFEPRLADADSEKVFIHLVGALFHPVLAGVWLAAILAAIMSTADSQLLVCSSALTEDLYKGLLRPGAGERELVWTGRAAVVVIAVLAMLLARDPESKVLDLVAYAWAGFGAAFGPTLLLALYWGGMSRNGALAGILVGAATVILWKQLQGGIFDLYEMVPGVLFSALAIVLVSRFGPEVEGEVRRQFVSISSPGPS